MPVPRTWFDYTSKRAKALIEIRCVEVSFLTADRPSDREPTNIFA